MTTFRVNLGISAAASEIYMAVVEGSITGECLDQYTIKTSQGSVTVMVFEKHYYRAGNRLTLTAVLDDTQGDTRVRLISGGGGEGLLRLDWGASKSFENVVLSALQPYRK